MEDAERLAGVEIKSGETLADDAARNLFKWRGYAKGRTTYLGLVYGGMDSYALKDVSVLSWQAL